MTKATKKGLVPELRFPEFRESGEWKLEPFNKIYNFRTTNSLSRDKLNYENGDVKNIHYGDIHTKFSTLFDITKETVPFINQSEPLDKIKQESYCQERDMIFADASEDIDDIGKSIEVFNLDNQKLVSGLHTLLARQLEEKLVKGFGGYLFKSNYIRKQIKKEAQGAKVLGISTGRLSSINVSYPKGETEQQKIADCLSSIDELISAQTEKIKSLKDHKTGLMQQLFPAKGENTPELRFPEFRGSGEWEDKNFYSLLDDVIDFRGRTPKKLGMDWGGGEILSLSANNVKNGFIDFDAECNLGSEELYKKWMDKVDLKKGDIVFTMEAPLGNALIIPDNQKYILSQRVVAFKTKSKVNNNFLIQLIWNENFQKKIYLLSTGSTAKGINQKTLKTIEVFFPEVEKEQQKIADCLSSLDDLINAHVKKLEALKSHKKGLMQQLFPSMDDISV